MAAKEVEFSVDARDRMLRDIDILASAMRMTFGPKGRNVVLEKSFGAPRIIKDGATVAKEIELGDKFENMGAQIVREVVSHLRSSWRRHHRDDDSPHATSPSPRPKKLSQAAIARQLKIGRADGFWLAPHIDPTVKLLTLPVCCTEAIEPSLRNTA